MRVSLVVTFTGPDRPGIVETLAKTVTLHQGNWEESRMAHLAGRFAGLFRIRVDEATADGLVAALQALDELTVTVDRGVEDDERPCVLQLEVTGADHPGIVHKVTQVLTQHQLNISTLDTETRDAPMSGNLLFVARATLQGPGDVDLDQLQAALEQLADDLVVDVSLEEPS